MSRNKKNAKTENQDQAVEQTEGQPAETSTEQGTDTGTAATTGDQTADTATNQPADGAVDPAPETQPDGQPPVESPDPHGTAQPNQPLGDAANNDKALDEGAQPKSIPADVIAAQNDLAGRMYSAYSEAVGGKAFNGDPLPGWDEFRADEKKKVQSEAWIAAARVAVPDEGSGIPQQSFVPADRETADAVTEIDIADLEAIEKQLSNNAQPTNEQKEALIHVRYALEMLRSEPKAE